jgi:hypothetical protein
VVAAAVSSAEGGESPSIQGLPTGRYRAIVSEGPLEATVHANEAVEFEHQALVDQEVPVSLRPGGTVCLQIATEEGAVPGPAAADVIDGAGVTVPFPGIGKRLRFNGITVLRGLPLGELKARVSIAGRGPLEVGLRVEPGRVARITRTIPR